MSKGLVLAGGGALGAYEIGAYEALQELGYKFDIVTGTSIGALNGAFIASNMFNELKSLWNNMNPTDVVADGQIIVANKISDVLNSDNKKVIKSYVKNKMSLDNTPLKEYMAKAFNFEKFYNCKTRLGVVTTAFPRMKEVDVYVKEVKPNLVIPYLFASSACVPIFPYEVIEGKKYIDGFFVDNLPIKLCFDMGATEIIAIDMRLFSLKPHHPFLINLPNVRYIAPYISLGSMIDFSQETIQRNKELGYLDVKKSFKILRGYYYCFENDFIINNFLSKIIKRYDTKVKIILSELSDGIRDLMDEEDYIYRTIEIIFEELGIKSYYKIFRKEEVIKVIRRELTNIDMIPFKNPNRIRKKNIFNKYLYDFLNEYILTEDKIE